jgi:hypothetical protein
MTLVHLGRVLVQVEHEASRQTSLEKLGGQLRGIDTGGRTVHRGAARR